MQKKLKEIRSGYDEIVVIHPQMISRADEQRYVQKMNDLSDADENKSQKEYDLCVEFLAMVSIEMPELITVEEGKEVRKPLTEAETPYDAVKGYFANKTDLLERVVHDLAFDVRLELQPKKSLK